MKKLLSALLVATLLIASAACVLAVSAEETGSTVIYNLLSEVKAADTADYTLVVNDNGSVTITLKREATADSAITIAENFSGGKFDATKQTYLAADIVCDNSAIDFRLHYTRKDKLADQFWSGMRRDDNAAYATKTDTSVVWDVTKYLTSDPNKLNDDHMHQYTDLMIMAGKKDDVLTINTLALISDASALVPGTPLVKPDANGNTSSEETSSTGTSSTETSSAGTSSTETPSTGTSSTGTSSTGTNTPAASSSQAPAASSSSAPGTGDAGLIVFAVLAVLAVVGGVVVVRARH